MGKIKKYVVVLIVLDTEDLKQKHALEEHASDGMPKYLKLMLKRQPIILTEV